MKEFERELYRKVDGVVDDYFTKKLQDVAESIDTLQGEATVEDSLQAVLDANSWLKTYANLNHQPDLYDDFKYHMYIVDNKLMIIQGKEIDTNPKYEK